MQKLLKALAVFRTTLHASLFNFLSSHLASDQTVIRRMTFQLASPATSITHGAVGLGQDGQRLRGFQVNVESVRLGARCEAIQFIHAVQLSLAEGDKRVVFVDGLLNLPAQISFALAEPAQLAALLKTK